MDHQTKKDIAAGIARRVLATLDMEEREDRIRLLSEMSERELGVIKADALMGIESALWEIVHKED